ncbi:hypothetical protein ACHELR_003543 [Vibrio fluvialis]
MIESANKEARINSFVELVIFLSSYYPLFLILFIQNISNKEGTIPVWPLELGYKYDPIAFIMLLISSICTITVGISSRSLLAPKPKSRYKNDGSKSIYIKESHEVNGDMINYTLPFLIGLFAFNYSSWQSIISLFVFLFFMFFFIRKESLILLNPLLLLLNVKLYKISYQVVGYDFISEARVIAMGEVKSSNVKVRMNKLKGISFIYSESDK